VKKWKKRELAEAESTNSRENPKQSPGTTKGRVSILGKENNEGAEFLEEKKEVRRDRVGVLRTDDSCGQPKQKYPRGKSQLGGRGGHLLSKGGRTQQGDLVNIKAGGGKVWLSRNVNLVTTNGGELGPEGRTKGVRKSTCMA